jgi:hypothetical protein
MINELIKHLKSRNKLQRFPFDKCKPIISKYPGFSRNDKKWLDFFYSVRGIADEGYIPLNYYDNFIEPCLTDQYLIAGIQEKNAYENLFKDIKAPKVILRKINGFYYGRDYSEIQLNDNAIQNLFSNYNRIIMKPSIESGSGKSILLFERKGNDLLNKEKILDTKFLIDYNQDFVVQQFVKQHEFFKKFNPASNNTIRIFVYRSVKDNNVHILHKLLRIGKEGSYLDHDNLGGVGISIKDGNFFDDFAYNYYGEKFPSIHNLKFSEMDKVPFIDEVSDIAKKIASRVFYSRLIALDFTVDESGDALLIEINCWGNGITQYQMNNGSLFKEYTEEILEYCYKASENKIHFSPRFSVKRNSLTTDYIKYE